MVTSLEHIKSKQAIEVSISGWDEEPFVCRLKRVGILDLAAQGKIPNSLMSTVVALFDKKMEVKNGEDVKNMANTINLFCNAAMVEPTYEEVQEIMPLTDDQRLSIFEFAQAGVKKAVPSVTEQGDSVDSVHGENVEEIAE